MTTDKQQEYHAAPDHPLWDILEIHALGYAVPWDGDKWVRYYKTKETKKEAEWNGFCIAHGWDCDHE